VYLIATLALEAGYMAQVLCGDAEKLGISVTPLSSSLSDVKQSNYLNPFFMLEESHKLMHIAFVGEPLSRSSGEVRHQPLKVVEL
jgi:hypothetical protein